jgi:hypothetical protein
MGVGGDGWGGGFSRGVLVWGGGEVLVVVRWGRLWGDGGVALLVVWGKDVASLCCRR